MPVEETMNNTKSLGRYSGPERRKERQEELHGIHARLRAGDERMGGFEALLMENTVLTQTTAEAVARIDENTSGFIAFSQDLVAGTRFLCRCAKGVQWVAEMLRKYLMLILLLLAAYAYATNQQKLLDIIFQIAKP